MDLGVSRVGDDELGQLDNADGAGDADKDAEEKDAHDARLLLPVDLEVQDDGNW